MLVLALHGKSAGFGDQIFRNSNVLAALLAIPRFFDATEWRFRSR